MRVLLSIKPEYVAKIFSGVKKFEYRKTLFSKNDVNTVLIYATMPIGKVVGEFKIGKILSDTPNGIWEQTKNYSGVDEDLFHQYFNGRDKAFAIQIVDAFIYHIPQSVSDILPRNHPPQSFCYV